MNETAASSDARRGETAAQLIARLSVQYGGNPIIEELVSVNDGVEANCLASALRASRHPELTGIGTTFNPKGSSEAGLIDRAKGQPNRSNNAVQRVVLHGATYAEHEGASDRAKTVENRSLPTAAGIGALVHGNPSGSETVQALSVKNSENNGCTVGSMSPPKSASRPASKDNFFASRPPARFTHADNERCTTPAPPSPVQEINPAGLLPATPVADVISEVPLAEVQLGYCRCDFFDNGPVGSRAATKSGRSRAQYRVNAFLGPDKRNHERFKISFLTEARFFKRRAPVGHSLFYEKVWDRFDKLRHAVRADSLPMAIKPVVAHLKDSNNHVVPRAAAVLFQMENEAADIFLFLDGSIFEIRLDQKAKGSQKCPALKSLGYWNPEK